MWPHRPHGQMANTIQQTTHNMRHWSQRGRMGVFEQTTGNDSWSSAHCNRYGWRQGYRKGCEHAPQGCNLLLYPSQRKACHASRRLCSNSPKAWFARLRLWQCGDRFSSSKKQVQFRGYNLHWRQHFCRSRYT